MIFDSAKKDSSLNVPRHVAVIMDGNNRWARSKYLPTGAGHRAGVKTVRMMAEFCAKHSVEILTLFAFSSENWRRPPEEVALLMRLMRRVLQKEVKKLHENNIKVLVIGDRTKFDSDLRLKMDQSEQLTANNTGMTLAVAVNYGGQWDITEATKQIARQVKAGELAPENITQESIESKLCLSDYPSPDLCIRTGGELRLSNFLMWQLAYAELYFTPVLWPSLNEKDLVAAFESYANRQRRFGQTEEQIIKAD